MAEIPDKNIERIRSLISKANTSLIAAEELLLSIVGDDVSLKAPKAKDVSGKIVEGIFNGQHMVSDDGRIYPIQANYASKSRLVQGDRMKLTIADDGAFVYKQIGPIERNQVIGVLSEQEGHFFVQVGERSYNVLQASVTHHKIKKGDHISISIPKDNETAEWAAIEAPL